MNILGILFGKKQKVTTPANFAVTDILELPLQKMNVSYEGSALEVSQSYSKGHQSLEPLLDCLVNPVDRNTALLFFKKLHIDKLGEFTSPHDVFRSTISLITVGEGKTTLKAWSLTEPSLGSGSNVLVVSINNPVMPMTLVCCKIGPGTYLAYYGDKSIRETLGIK